MGRFTVTFEEPVVTRLISEEIVSPVVNELSTVLERFSSVIPASFTCKVSEATSMVESSTFTLTVTVFIAVTTVVAPAPPATVRSSPKSTSSVPESPLSTILLLASLSLVMLLRPRVIVPLVVIGDPESTSIPVSYTHLTLPTNREV